MKDYIKGGIVGIAIWILFILTFKISGTLILINCSLPTDEFGFIAEGISCWNFIQKIIISILLILSFPFFLLGANPNLSTVGPQGVTLFWVGSAISFILWGILISWIIEKRKFKRR